MKEKDAALSRLQLESSMESLPPLQRLCSDREKRTYNINVIEIMLLGAIKTSV